KYNSVVKEYESVISAFENIDSLKCENCTETGVSFAELREQVSSERDFANETQKTILAQFFNYDPISHFKKEENRHAGVIGKLVYESLKQGYTKLKEIEETKYLDFIELALKTTYVFKGVNRNPISWFENYPLFSDTLRDEESMTTKRRIFVLKEKELIEQMINELHDNGKMKTYWENTGEMNDTYWIEESLLREEFTIPDKPIRDFAFYDDLVIMYDKNGKTLEYKMKVDNDIESAIYDALDSDISHRKGAFKKIEYKKYINGDNDWVDCS
ncbi:hypothetical protein ACFL6I_26525, partial [candidate division KSB1 bacterium]